MSLSIQNVIKPSGMTDERVTVGARVRTLRERAGWSQVELSRRSGVPQNTLSALETGESKRPNANTLRRIADAFLVPLDVLTGDAPIANDRAAPPPDGDPLERALFRALEPDRHRPSAFDAARRAVRERGSLDATAAELGVAPATLDRWIAEGVL